MSVPLCGQTENNIYTDKEKRHLVLKIEQYLPTEYCEHEGKLNKMEYLFIE